MRWTLPLIFALGCDRATVPQAAELYRQGEYDRAIEALDQAGGEHPSGVLLYDLGDAQYRKGDVGQAIAAWRGARDRRPRDGAAAHNLALARASLVGVPEPVPMYAAWMEVVTPGELGAIGAILLAIGSIGGLYRARARHLPDAEDRPLTWATTWAAPWTCGALIGAVAIEGRYAEEPVAVVIEAGVPLRAEPVAEAASKGELPAGTEVTVERHAGPFVRVRAADDRWGWVAEEALSVVR